ncbi:MAG TPA: UPF0758 domain-containing protein [Nitrospiria bacterium]|jgi:DNA repair protein RadC
MEKVDPKKEWEEWHHPGGKFYRLGASRCSHTDLLAILIGSGLPGWSAEQIAEDLMIRFQSLENLSQQSLEELMKVKGLKRVKAVRIGAAFEIAKRLSQM